MDFNFESCLYDVKESFAVILNEKNLAFISNIDTKIPATVNGDSGRFQQILRNLVSNAIKFTSQGSITVTAELQNPTPTGFDLYCEISDTGIGIRPDLHASLFEKFSQTDSSNTRKYGGTGLGLSICKSLVQMMGGSIGLQSEVEKGSTFWFKVHLKNAKTEVAPAHAHSAVQFKNSKITGRILIAEDNPINQKIALKLVEKMGCRADTVGNGQEAITALTRAPYDLILMDCQMPEMDGYEATLKIREIEKLLNKKRIPIIALTAAAMGADQQKCVEVGMDDYLTKPVDFQKVWQVLEKWLKK